MQSQNETWWERRGDLAVTIVLASVTVLLAWAGFQASKWSGVQAVNFSDAGRARTDSNALTDLGATAVSIDTSLFISWLEAAEPVLSDGGGVEEITSGQGGAPFLYRNFPDRLRVAVDDWLTLDADLAERGLPFDLDSYVVAEFEQARQLREDASDFGDEARQNNQQSDIYVLATVVFAATLFLAGVSQKMATEKAQIAVFAVAAIIAIFGAFILVTQPIEFVRADLPI